MIRVMDNLRLFNMGNIGGMRIAVNHIDRIPAANDFVMIIPPVERYCSPFSEYENQTAYTVWLLYYLLNVSLTNATTSSVVLIDKIVSLNDSASFF